MLTSESPQIRRVDWSMPFSKMSPLDNGQVTRQPSTSSQFEGLPFQLERGHYCELLTGEINFCEQAIC